MPETPRPESWIIRHFSLANPAGPGRANVPTLLRRVAEAIEAHGEVVVQDITFEQEVTEDGVWPSMTIYFDYREAIQGRATR